MEYTASHVLATISEGKWRNQTKYYYLLSPYNVHIFLCIIHLFCCSYFLIFVCNLCPGLLIHYSNNEYLLISTISSDNLESLFISKTKQMSLFYFYMLFAKPQLSFRFEIRRLTGTIGLDTRRLIFPTHKTDMQHSCSRTKFFLKSSIF